MSGVVGGYGCEHEKEVKCISPFTSTGAILVLFILLVIITKACIF
ncbi:YjcZ family sporulation protein [Paenibacillus sp. FSL H7-0357]|nr:sporulation protein YjcZ [Paenibacillus sp. FSL H7-0357]